MYFIQNFQPKIAIDCFQAKPPIVQGSVRQPGWQETWFWKVIEMKHIAGASALDPVGFKGQNSACNICPYLRFW